MIFPLVYNTLQLLSDIPQYAQIAIILNIVLAPCAHGDVRLTGGQSENEGRLEICNSLSVWGTVCNKHWTQAVSKVACHSFGYGYEEGAHITEIKIHKCTMYISVTGHFKSINNHVPHYPLYRVISHILHVQSDTSHLCNCCGLCEMFRVRELTEGVHLLQPQLF